MPKGIYPHHHVVKKTYAPAIVDTVRALYGEGLTQLEVAQRLSVTQKVVYRLMLNHGIARRPSIKRDQRGERNSSWRGEEAGYTALHHRMEVLHGRPRRCDLCGSTTAPIYDWANLTGRYADPADYKRMCRSCHRRYDNQRRREGVVAHVGG